MNLLNHIETNGGFRWPSRDQRTPRHNVKILCKFVLFGFYLSFQGVWAPPKSIFPQAKLLIQCMSNHVGVIEHVLFSSFLCVCVCVYKCDSEAKKLILLSTH